MKARKNYLGLLYLLFKRPLEKSYSLHNSIDSLPISLWFKINETNDYTLLIKSGKANSKQLERAWFSIMEQYVEFIGINEEYKEVLELKKKLYLTKINYALTKNRVLLNFIQIYEEDLRRLNIPTKKEDSYKIIVSVEKYLGFRINEYNCSTRKFFNYLKMAKLESEAIEAKKNLKNG